MAEVRIFREGALRWVQASGTGQAWSTASAAPTGLIGYVRAGMTIASAQEVSTVMERGIPDHHKVMSKTPPEVTFTYLQAVTAQDPARLMLTASGGTVPTLHFELKMDAKELGAASALYYQFHYAALISNGWTEADDGNPKQQTWRAIAMSGENATGYIA